MYIYIYNIVIIIIDYYCCHYYCKLFLFIVPTIINIITIIIYIYNSVYRQNSLANKHANPNSFVPGSSSIALDAEPVHHLLDVVPVVSCIVENKPIFRWLFIYIYNVCTICLNICISYVYTYHVHIYIYICYIYICT